MTFSTFRSTTPDQTYFESSESGEVTALDGLPVQVDGEHDQAGWLSASFPTVGITDYPVLPAEVIPASVPRGTTL